MFVRKPLNVMLSFALVAMAGAAQAASVPNTVPALPIGDAAEMTSPYVLSAGYTQKVIANRSNQIALGQGNSGNWDMIDSNRTGADANRYLFMPFETGTGGVQRVDLWDTNYNTRTVTIVAPGTQGFVSGDASRWTPWGTYLTAEESWSDPAAAVTSGKGRLFEVTNPTTAAANGGVFEHRKIGPADIRVSHEGLAFDKANNFYFIDERNDSHIFKFTSSNPNATNGADFFGAGQTSVLRVGDGTTQEATGAYTWVALTDAAGNALPGTIVKTDANGMTILDGRATPNEAAFLGTNFDRPEDLEIQDLANGDQRLYVATTTNHNVFALDLANSEIDLFVSRDTEDEATGVAVGSVFSSPDNLAIGPDGTMYIIEDQNGGVENLWRAVDADKDGIAESMSVFATLRTTGAESTGMYFLGDKIYINVQHPASGNDVLVEISPVPEAETYAMMLAGLGLVGFAAARRKSVK
ncbi:MAG: phosphatase [Hydrogenophilales bacterium RIFOXYD1_FULL_62_11]|nr:MAG: phosphatase [Hydrogenophilales bacterium RIFOXYD1_FULL_62_11]